VTKAAIGRGLAPGLPMHLPIVIIDGLPQRTRSSSSSSFSSTSSSPSPSSYGGSCLARRLTSFPLSRLLDTFTSPSVRVLGFSTITIHHTHTRLSSCPSFSFLDFARQLSDHVTLARALDAARHCAFAVANDCDSGRPTPYKRAYPTERYYEESGRPSRTTTRSLAWNPPPPPVPSAYPYSFRCALTSAKPCCQSPPRQHANRDLPHPVVLLVDLRPGTNDRVPSSRSSASKEKKKKIASARRVCLRTSSVTGET